jgi:transcriptional repressor NrdR
MIKIVFILMKMETFKYHTIIQHDVGWDLKTTICCILWLSGENRMECPYCNNNETKVTDSRDTGTYTIRRRRECLKCNKRFTTYEYIELTPIYVKKKDGRLEKFDRNKIKNGITKALEKRPVSHEKIEGLLNSIEEKIRRTGQEEIESKIIGEFVMDALKETDHVAYIRFASVYRSFADVSSFEEEIKNLTKQNVVGGIK